MRSASSTSQSQQTDQTSNQLNIGDTGGSVITGSGNIVTNTDHKAIYESFEFAKEMGNNSFEFAGGAFDTAAGVLVASLDGVTNAANRNVENVLTYGAGLTMANLESNERARDQAFDFASGAFKEAVSTQNAALQLTNQFATEAFQQTRYAADAIVDANASARSDIRKAQDYSYQFASGAFTKALDSANEQNAQYSDDLKEFAAKAIDTAVMSTKTESAQTTDKIIQLTGDTTKYVMYAALGLGAAMLLTRMK